MQKIYAGMRIPCTPTLSITQYNFSYIIRQSYPYCTVIWLKLAPNMAGIASQYGWDWIVTRLKVSCL